MPGLRAATATTAPPSRKTSNCSAAPAVRAASASALSTMV